MAANTPTAGSNDGGLKTSFLTTITETSATDLEGVGTVRFQAGKVYMWVKFDNGTGNLAAIANYGAEWYGQLGWSTRTVTRDSTDGQYVTAGIFTSVIADGEYGWIQIRGPVTLGTTLETTAIPNNAVMCGTDGAFTKFVGDGTIGTAPRFAVGQVLTATTASAPVINLNIPW